jgi:hypothetical protein
MALYYKAPSKQQYIRSFVYGQDGYELSYYILCAGILLPRTKCYHRCGKKSIHHIEAAFAVI